MLGELVLAKSRLLQGRVLAVLEHFVHVPLALSDGQFVGRLGGRPRIRARDHSVVAVHGGCSAYIGYVCGGQKGAEDVEGEKVRRLRREVALCPTPNI